LHPIVRTLCRSKVTAAGHGAVKVSRQLTLTHFLMRDSYIFMRLMPENDTYHFGIKWFYCHYSTTKLPSTSRA